MFNNPSIFKSIFFISVFGVIGVLLRFVIVLLIAPKSPQFPTGTMIVNILGSFCIGLIAAVPETKYFGTPEMKNYLIVGLLGGFTTFSSFSYEVISLAQIGRPFAAMMYGLGSPVLGVLSAYLGILIPRIFR